MRELNLWKEKAKSINEIIGRIFYPYVYDHTSKTNNYLIDRGEL